MTKSVRGGEIILLELHLIQNILVVRTFSTDCEETTAKMSKMSIHCVANQLASCLIILLSQSDSQIVYPPYLRDKCYI